MLTPSTTDVGLSVKGSVAVAGGSGGYTYAWIGLPAGCAGSPATIDCSPTTIGTYIVAVAVADSNGFSVASVPVALTINAPLSAPSIQGPTGARNTGQTITFSAQEVGGTAPLTWTWVFGDGTRGSGPVVSHVCRQAGTYIVRVWVNDSAGDSVTQRVVVTINQAPTFLSLPATEGYIVVGGIIAIVFVLAAVAILLSRRGKAPPKRAETPTPPAKGGPPGRPWSAVRIRSPYVTPGIPAGPPDLFRMEGLPMAPPA